MASRGLKLSKAIFDALFEKYTSAVTSTDVETIVSIYAADAKIEIPVGGPVHDGFDAIQIPLPCALPIGFMIHVPPRSLNSLNSMFPSLGSVYVTGMKSNSDGSRPSFTASLIALLTFFAMRSLRVNSTWFGKWFTRW